MNGEHLKSQEHYEPVRNEDGAIAGFRQMSAYLHQFSGEEQKLIFQYALNTKSNLQEELEQIIKIVKNLHQLQFGRWLISWLLIKKEIWSQSVRDRRQRKENQL